MAADNSFDSASFFQKLTRSLKKTGRSGLEKILWLYYAAQKPETPVWAKAKIYGALAYFGMPLDAVPDALPGGYVDDLAVVATALTAVSFYIDKEVKAKARKKLDDLFG